LPRTLSRSKQVLKKLRKCRKTDDAKTKAPEPLTPMPQASGFIRMCYHIPNMQERLPSPAMMARQEQISDFYTLVADKVKNGELKSDPQGYNFKVTIAEQTF